MTDETGLDAVTAYGRETSEFHLLEPFVVRVDRETAAPAAFQALRAVLHLHRPDEAFDNLACSHCEWEWPCPTAREIREILRGATRA